MSYILAALKKAERERKPREHLQLQDLDAEHWEPPPASRSQLPVRLILAIALVFMLGLAALFWRLQGVEQRFASLRQPATSTPVESESIPPASSTPEPDTRQRQSAFSATPTAATTAGLPESLPLEGVLYFDDQPERARAFIGGSGYSQGAQWQPGVHIEQIHRDGVTLTDGTSSRTYSIR